MAYEGRFSLDRRSLSVIQKQQLAQSEELFQPKWERADVGAMKQLQRAVAF